MGALTHVKPGCSFAMWVRRRVTAILFLLAPCFVLSGSSYAVNVIQDQADLTCESAEDCYRAALNQVMQAMPSGSAPVQGDRVQSTIQRLKAIQERHPGSIWAKRAGLLTGLLLAERDPGDAIFYFKVAQRDMPLLDDYIRFWIADALLALGDALRAAVLLEGIPEAVPDTLLVNRVAFRGGEAWYRADQCRKAMELLERAVSLGPQDPLAPSALLQLADCQMRETRVAEGQATLKQIWIRYPQAPEASEAATRLTRSLGGETWRPTPEEQYGRASAFLNLALYEEAVADIQKFLAASPGHSKRGEARLKLGTALVRLKRYEQARQVFLDLTVDHAAESDDAAVWLARVYLRQGEGDKLLALPQLLSRLALSEEQKTTIQMLMGTWLEDQGRYDQALAKYRQAAQAGEGTTQRADALWRIGWLHYRTGHFSEARETFQDLSKGKEDGSYAPQALYWLARASERQKDRRAADLYLKLCRQYAFTYYCQLAQFRTELPGLVQVSASGDVPAAGPAPSEGRPAVVQDVHYLRAVELKLLGMDQDAARELASLIERYVRDRPGLIELSTLLSEAGAYHHALRLARLHFREGLERGGESVPPALWNVAYPTAYLPTIRVHAGSVVDPYLVAAIIREESQYDARAVSRVGAVGLMQVMPATAQAVAKKQGLPDVGRDDLFDQETNIRVGVRYVEQLLQQFSGNPVQAVAAYNAGPQIVTTWIAKNGHREPDEFVELIPYQETRQYVKRVLRSYREYRRLDGGGCEVRFLDKVC